MSVKGIRGAITVAENSKEEILSATSELLLTILSRNKQLKIQDIASVIFSATEDLDKVYPAKAARDLGWNNVPLFCTQEMKVEGSITKCIRVLIHWNTEFSQTDIEHVYLRKASVLRPDLIQASTKTFDPDFNEIQEETRS